MTNLKRGLIKALSILFILILLGVLILKQVSKYYVNSDTVLGRVSNILNKNNEFKLVCTKLDRSHVDVTWIVETTSDNIIIENGKRVGEIGYEYGSNMFKIKVAPGVEFNFGHFKTNNWHSHKYEIEIEKNSNGYGIDFIAKDPDYEYTKQSFNLIGIPHGEMSRYYENSKCAYRGRYENGLKQGRFLYYHKNGNIRASMDYLNDKLNGYKTTYDEDGQIEFVDEFQNGIEIETK